MYFKVLLISFLSFFMAVNIQAKEEPSELNISKILKMEINSPITPATYDYLKSGIEKLGKKSGATAALITMNTPGGLVSTTKDILTLFGKSDYPIFVWVMPEGASATSAGSIISCGAHLLYMTEGTNIGAATPIKMSGDIEQKDGRTKAINDLVALVKGLSDIRGRNGKLFGEMISKGKSFSAREAEKSNIINGIANTEAELFKMIDGKIIIIKGKKQKINGSNLVVIEHKMKMGQKILAFFANPAMAYILFLIGAALIYLEFQAPGGFIAGSIGALFLIIAGIGFQVLPINVGALFLIAGSLVLFILEIYIISYGALALAGVAALITGSMLLFKTPDAFMAVNEVAIWSAIAGVLSFIAFVAYFFVKEMSHDRPDFFSLKGKEADVLELIEKNGNQYTYLVKVSGERWKATSIKEFTPGDKCKIINQDKIAISLVVE